MSLSFLLCSRLSCSPLFLIFLLYNALFLSVLTVLSSMLSSCVLSSLSCSPSPSSSLLQEFREKVREQLSSSSSPPGEQHAQASQQPLEGAN